METDIKQNYLRSITIPNGRIRLYVIEVETFGARTIRKKKEKFSWFRYCQMWTNYYGEIY